MTHYTAASLEDIAARFEQFAEDEFGLVRSARSQNIKMICANRGDVWRDAASILRNTKLEAATND